MKYFINCRGEKFNTLEDAWENMTKYFLKEYANDIIYWAAQQENFNKEFNHKMNTFFEEFFLCFNDS